MAGGAPDPPDYEEQRLAKRLDALSNATRLRILDAVRQPSALRDLEITKPRADGTSRPLARQTVKEHLDRLVEHGLVQTRTVSREYGETVEYALDHQRLFALADVLSSLSRQPPETEPERATEPAPRQTASDAADRPCLVLARGANVGRTFDLTHEDREEWVIGRRRDADIPLHYDPYVSAENALVRRTGDGFAIVDLLESRNGTRVNFEAISADTPVALRPGDLVGVGRSLLAFRA